MDEQFNAGESGYIMAQSMRGVRLGAQSLEDDRGVKFAERQYVAYACSNGHEFDVAFSVQAMIPPTWECPRCHGEALGVGIEQPPPVDEKPVRSHWDMLLERRSIPDLEALLAERLDLLRRGKIGPAHLHRGSA